MIIEHTNCTHHIKPLFKVKGIDFYAGAEVDWDYFVEDNPGLIGVTLNLRGFAAGPTGELELILELAHGVSFQPCWPPSVPPTVTVPSLRA